ncbi:hypothetical protein ACFFJ7_18525 [Pseudochelatococcus lubricantis]|uniref:hypothetical protein n=1 Tax=Pseudochelatococcus lubricantis TaxID=1538102 RepID=UPI0035ED6C8B
MLRRAVILGAALLALTSASFMALGETMSGTPLHTAAKRDDVARIAALLAEGAAIDARDDSGATALLVATHENNLADREGVTPLQHARGRGHGEIGQLLVAAGAR